MKASGFSLIELMVVVAIVAVLAAVSLPSYYNYINKSKIIEAVSTSSYWLNEALSSYNINGVFPYYMVLSPTGGVYDNAYILGDTDGPYAIYYHRGINSTGASIWVSIAGLSGVDGYNNPVSLPQDVYIFSNANQSMLTMGIRVNNGITEYQCGNRYSNDNMSLPLDMLPSGCTCANIGQWVDGGSC